MQIKYAFLFSAAFFSLPALATPRLETVIVTGSRMGDGTVICEGSDCQGLWGGAPDIASPLPVEAFVPDETPVESIACSDDVDAREAAVWSFYRQRMATLYPNAALRILADADLRGQDMTIIFSDGSTAVYRRAETELASSVGMNEVSAPDCD